MTVSVGPLRALADVRALSRAQTVPGAQSDVAQSDVAQGGGPTPLERCGLCAEPIDDDHRHLVDLRQRTLVCTCRPCNLLFANPGSGSGHLRTVPDRYQVVEDFALSSVQWDSLQIPVSVAFFFTNSERGNVDAFFPSPAGATECLLPLDTWDEVVAANPVLGTIEPDVEAALVRMPADGATSAECYLVPIDACYELVGRLRALWRGFDGGSEARRAMSDFFAGLAERGHPVPGSGR
ncbi:MAG: DUF5947 family protein [Acidimicrobiales bacterium]